MSDGDQRPCTIGEIGQMLSLVVGTMCHCNENFADGTVTLPVDPEECPDHREFFLLRDPADLDPETGQVSRAGKPNENQMRFIAAAVDFVLAYDPKEMRAKDVLAHFDPDQIVRVAS